MSFFTRRPGAILIGAVAALLTVIAAGRPWIEGTVDDAMIGGSLQQVTGDEAVTGIVALGLVLLAGAVAAAASRRIGRRIAAVILLLISLVMATLVLRVVIDPSGILGSIAAASTGRTGSLTALGEATAWAYLGLVPVAGGLLLAALAWRGATAWPQPSSAYDRPGAERPGQRGERVTTDWELLSEGEDPTADGAVVDRDAP